MYQVAGNLRIEKKKNEKVLGITPQRMLHHTNLEQYCIALEDLENIFSPLLN